MTALLAIAFSPAAALLAYIYVRDVYEPEPRALVLAVFFLGVPLVLPAALVESLLMPLFAGDVVLESFLITGLTEELVKFLVVLILADRISHFNEEMDGVVYSSALALGFAFAENALYIFVQGIPTGLLRAILPVPGHALFAIVMGSYIGKAKFEHGLRRTTLLAKGLFLPAILHGAFDYFLSGAPLLAALAVPLMAYLWFQGLHRIRSATNGSPFRGMTTPTKREVA